MGNLITDETVKGYVRLAKQTEVLVGEDVRSKLSVAWPIDGPERDMIRRQVEALLDHVEEVDRQAMKAVMRHIDDTDKYHHLRARVYPILGLKGLRDADPDECWDAIKRVVWDDVDG